jgi:nitrate/TMAO reductase-like tetraheme cytochrome c subunit
MTNRHPLLRHPVSVLGALMATVGGVLFVIVYTLELLGWHANPYMGIVVFLILPMVFVLGLLLMPVGWWFDRRRRLAGKPVELHWPVLDLRHARQRRWTFFVIVATLVNVVIISLAAYSGVHFMDSVSFCGQVCHEVMEPEFAAYQDGPHSRVTCVQCHIGEGASWFVRSKLSGARQVWAVAVGSYARPIPSPVHNLRPARETCETCHWPEKFHGDKVRMMRSFSSDETNTESQMTLLVHVGGGSDRLGVATGIHWHMNLANEIEYIATDDKRQVIPWVRLKDASGNVREFQVDGVTAEDLAKGERRRMDCIDCHNRPSHPFDPSAERAVDRALAMGGMSTKLPFIKREATAALAATYPSRPAALDAIASKLREFYRTQYPEVYMAGRQEVERAVTATQQLYRRNIFPSMNLTWGSYANNIGHMDFPGCFRCHDDSHKTRDGKVIRQDCDLCHTIQ